MLMFVICFELISAGLTVLYQQFVVCCGASDSDRFDSLEFSIMKNEEQMLCFTGKMVS